MLGIVGVAMASSERTGVLVAGVKGCVIGLDRALGRERWRTRIELGDSLVAIARMDHLVLAAGRERLACLGVADGTLVWHTRLSPGPTGRTLLYVEGERVVVQRGGLVECFDRDGARIWSWRTETSGELDVSTA
jgi:outer membrane protein assembly factor BamB